MEGGKALSIIFSKPGLNLETLLVAFLSKCKYRNFNVEIPNQY